MGATLDLLGNAYDILKNNPKIIVPYLIISVFTAILQNLIPNSGFGSGALGLGVAFSVVAIVIFGYLIVFVLQIFLTGFYVSIADQGYKKETISFDKAFAVAKQNFVRILLTYLLLFVIAVIVAIVLIAIFLAPLFALGLFSGSSSSSTGLAGAGIIVILFGLALIIIIPLTILITILLYQLYPALVLETLGPVNAIKRSIAIGRNNMVPILLVFLATAAVGFLFAIIPYLIAVGISLLNQLAGSILSGIVQSIVVSWSSLIPVLFYYNYVAKPASTSLAPKTTPPSNLPAVSLQPPAQPPKPKKPTPKTQKPAKPA